jgi:hypothetical protein
LLAIDPGRGGQGVAETYDANKNAPERKKDEKKRAPDSSQRDRDT